MISGFVRRLTALGRAGNRTRRAESVGAERAAEAIQYRVVPPSTCLYQEQDLSAEEPGRCREAAHEGVGDIEEEAAEADAAVVAGAADLVSALRTCILSCTPLEAQLRRVRWRHAFSGRSPPAAGPHERERRRWRDLSSKAKGDGVISFRSCSGVQFP